MLSDKYYTLKSAIPLEAKKDPKATRIGMDTGSNRNGLHLWIGGYRTIEDDSPLKEGQKRRKKTVHVSQSVHLSRDDAWNLIEEIKERLF